MCREALLEFNLSLSEAQWFVPREDRPAVNATVKVLANLGLAAHRYPEIRVRVGRFPAAREKARFALAEAYGSATRWRSSVNQQQFDVAIASHNISAWAVAKQLRCDSWVLIDSSRMTSELGYLDAMRAAGIQGVFEVSAFRGKSLSSTLRKTISDSAPASVVFFTAFGHSGENVVRNHLRRLKSEFDELPVDEETMLVVGQKGFPLDHVFYKQLVNRAPEIRRLVYKPHPRDLSSARGLFASGEPTTAGVNVMLTESDSAVEELPITLGYLPHLIVGQQASTALDLLSIAANGRAVVEILRQTGEVTR